MSDTASIDAGGVEFAAQGPTVTWDTDTAVGVLALTALGVLIGLRRLMPTP